MDPRSKNQYFSDILDSKIILDRYAEIYSAALKLRFTYASVRSLTTLCGLRGELAVKSAVSGFSRLVRFRTSWKHVR